MPGRRPSRPVALIALEHHINGNQLFGWIADVRKASLPGARTVEEIEALLPWALTGEEVSRRYAEQPAPGHENADPAP